MRLVLLAHMVESEIPLHASLRYEDLENIAPSARPLDFPAPKVNWTRLETLSIRDHRTRRIHSHVRLVLVRYAAGFHPLWDRAYVIKKKLAKSTFGSIRLCEVLRPVDENSNDCDADGHLVRWESTDEYVVVKASSWARIRKLRGRTLEDPLKEASALQYVGSYHQHVQGCVEVLQDDEHIYTIVKYCSGGDLYSRILGTYCTGNKKVSSLDRPNEVQARIWFRQLLNCLLHLQRKGICHRDISLDNLMLDEFNNLILIDFGLALRVPYVDSSNYGGVADVSEGTSRRLITRQGQSGSLIYLAPELVEPEGEFDGFAVDLWSAGVVLFILLVGMAPFEWANVADHRYSQINKGRLVDLVQSLNLPISEQACHLLQNMFWRNPRKRFTLAQVLTHPWVVGSQCHDDEAGNESQVETPRSFFSPKGLFAVPAEI